MKLLIVLVVSVVGAVSGQCRSGWEYISASHKCIGLAQSCPSGTSAARIGSWQETQAAISLMKSPLMANIGNNANSNNRYSNWASGQPSPDGSQVFILPNGEWYTYIAAYAHIRDRPYICEQTLNQRPLV
ncbi:uncharacterized protein LOC141911232 [Tubulanus polymorphus]|uniref:uncharacterized protein LOC141911232 n=1 Tax=Tubulanus polymorphus TaxID=672921 RepID=UPI003DA5F70D